MITFNGKPFNSGDFARSLEKKVVESALSQLRKRFGTIRDPDTGEFPTVFATGDTLSELRVRVEGSASLMAIIKERFAPEELRSVSLVVSGGTPQVFLSYAFDDTSLAEKIAKALQASGIETWWANWCISAGDSLRRKIDEGISGCTHFVVLLTPNSLGKPWVNQEMDAGFVRKLNDQCRFIVLRHNLSASQLPPLLSGLLSPEVDADACDLQQLINDIHGITKKPPLGPAPAVHKAATSSGGRYSPAAMTIAELFVRGSEHALSHEPQMEIEEVMRRTGLSQDDVSDAMHELTGLAEVYFGERVWPKPALFAEFDSFWMPWNPEEDALRLAADLVNDVAFPSALPEIGPRYGWAPRRLNAAVAYLEARDLARVSQALGTQPWLTLWVQKTDATRRFVKSRSL